MRSTKVIKKNDYAQKKVDVMMKYLRKKKMILKGKLYV